MNNLKVLIADDEEKIRQAISVYLKREGCTVGEAADGQEALTRLGTDFWDVVILDLMMPKMDGLEVCQEVRKVSDVPIIILTAKTEEIDRIQGFESGADDYVSKPFSLRELMARIKAVTRRNLKTENHLIRCPGLSLNLITREVVVMDKPVWLTIKEFELLSILARYPGKIFSREQLLIQVWNYDYRGEARTVDTHINRLREKLRVNGAPSYISTMWGIGYKFELSPGESEV
ncbi:MAG: response regulator transcription factor [Desulfitobacterium hafniense]|nr:response regulator transcription factor [Desulfitobacterium hafniense]